MKRIFVLLIGAMFLSAVHSAATPLENIEFQVEMFYKCTKELNGGSGPQRTKGKQPDCPISIYVNNINRDIAFVGIDNSMTVSFIITDEQGDGLIFGDIANDSTTIDISDLTEGSYTLNVIINDICFIGRFDIETEIL